MKYTVSVEEYTKLKKSFSENAFKKPEEKTFEKALEKAYADMSRRATGHKSKMKAACINWLIGNKLFDEVLKCDSQSAFDKWHEGACIDLKRIHASFGRIGRSQKVINMALKYLSCIDNRYDDILKYCHMTLDGYTLNWYKSIGGISQEWSKIDDYEEYLSIQEKIRIYLKDHHSYDIKIGNRSSKSIPLSELPFEAEFIIWEGEIIKTKYNELIKSLDKYKAKGKKTDNWLIASAFDDYLRVYCSNL